MSNIVIADVKVGDRIRTEDGASHEVRTVWNRGDYVQVTFTCRCPALVQAPNTMVELIGPGQQPRFCFILDRVENWGKIQIRKPENCLHGETICSSWDCVESWSIDQRLHFYRTVGGRKLAADLGLTEDADVIGTPERYVSREEYLAGHQHACTSAPHWPSNGQCGAFVFPVRLC